jgi:hypothetical protein
MQSPSQPAIYRGSFEVLKHVIMGRMEYSWSQILDCALMWPSVETLQVCNLKVNLMSEIICVVIW